MLRRAASPVALELEAAARPQVERRELAEAPGWEAAAQMEALAGAPEVEAMLRGAAPVQAAAAVRAGAPERVA